MKTFLISANGSKNNGKRSHNSVHKMRFDGLRCFFGKIPKGPSGGVGIEKLNPGICETIKNFESRDE